jgi:hypothetical protein
LRAHLAGRRSGARAVIGVYVIRNHLLPRRHGKQQALTSAWRLRRERGMVAVTTVVVALRGG